MWKLTVTRTYRKDTTWDLHDKHYFQSENIDDLMRVIEVTQKYATDGKYSYEFEFIEGESNGTENME